MPPAADLLRAALAGPLGPHPAADTLRQYAAGALAPAQQHRVEAHALDCPRCADVLAGLAQTDAAATDQALAALRHRLHARVAAEAAPRPAAGAWHWPRLAAAAALVAGLVGGGLWEWQHRAAPAAEVATVAAPPAAGAPAAAPAAEPAGPPAPPPAAATAATAASAPPATVAAAPARQRPAPVVAYEPRRRAARKLAAPAVEREEVVAMRAMANDDANRPPAPAAATATTVSGVATDSTAGRLNEVALSQARPAAPAARVLMGRVAGVAVVPTAPTESTAVARRLAFAAPANGAVVGTMPAAPALAPAPVGGLGPLRDQLRRAAAEFVPNEAPLKGNVRVRFTVGDDGKLSNLKVVRGLRPDYDAEALRLVCEGPGWVPGTAAGRRAALPVELDVVF